MNIDAKSIRKLPARLTGIGTLTLAAVLPVHATLGGMEATVAADQAQSKANLRTVYGEKYMMH